MDKHRVDCSLREESGRLPTITTRFESDFRVFVKENIVLYTTTRKIKEIIKQF